MLGDDTTIAARGRHEDAPATRRRKGRPLEMAPEEVLRLIRGLGEGGALFRVHREHPALYARARRQFGSWAGALSRAGLDHGAAVAEARRRSVVTRRAGDGERPRR